MKKLFIIFIILLVNLFIYADASQDRINKILEKTKTAVTKTDIKIGEKITIVTQIPDLKEVKVLWEDMTKSDQSCDIITTKDTFKDNVLTLEIVYTFFDPGTYKNFYMTIPLAEKGNELLYFSTKEYTVTVVSALSDDEKENIKKLQDPSQAQLKKEKDQLDMPFKLDLYIKIILIVLGIIILGLIVYYVLFNLIFKKIKNADKEKKMTPYDKVIKTLGKLDFSIDEDRKLTENKLSILTEALKELIYGEFDLNAPSETTRELIASLRIINFDNDITIEINKLFTEIDMIKFAKSPFDFTTLTYCMNSVKNLGEKINYIYLKKKELEEQVPNKK